MPKYQIQKGHEYLVFSGEGIRRLDDSTVESDYELNSPYLTLVKDSDEMTAKKPETDQPAPTQVLSPTPAPAPTPTQTTQTEEPKL